MVIVDEKILDALPHADAGYRAAVNTMKSNYLEGTRQDLLANLDDWVQGQSADLASKSICILSGGAGTGKSTIASEFARRLDEYGILGASFFFIRGMEDLATTRLFFPTIAYQLAHSQSALRQPIVIAAREHLKQGKNQQMKYEAGNLLQHPLRTVDGRHPPIFLIVDALDECTEQASELTPKMLELLMACVREASFPIRVFFTSRPEHLVERALSAPSCTPCVHTISLDNLSRESVDRDVGILVRDRLSRIPGSKTLFEEHPDVVGRIVQRAEGLFIYARTAMDFLASYPDDLQEHADMLLSDDSAARALVLGPLDDLYLTVLESAFPPQDMERHERLRARVEPVLGCVALLRDHLSPRVLEALTHIPTRETKSVLNRLRAVVLFNADNFDDIFRPMHATFPQFLVDSERCRNRLYLVDTKKQHARLAEGCLRTLLYLSRNMCNLPDVTVSKTDIPDLEARVCEHVAQHVQYACVHWAAHLAKAARSGQLCALLWEFVGSKMLVWLETLGYMGRLDVAIDSLTMARNWLNVSFRRFPSLRRQVLTTAACWKRDGKARERMDQGRQLVMNYQAEIDECPDAVYHSKIDQETYTLADFEYELGQ